MLSPLVSILMPCFNAEKFLRSALVSIQNQSYSNFELIAINDGSSDGTESILSDFDNSRLVYIKNELNVGVAASLNRGLSVAKGEYIARFDADDLMYSNRLFDQVTTLLDEANRIDLLGGGADVFGDIETVHRQQITHPDIVNQMLLNNPFIHPTIMFRRELYDRGLFKYREDMSTEEDYELWCRILPNIRATNLPWPIIRYRIHGSNNQRIPGKAEAKELALTEFLEQYGISNPPLVSALADFQCSGYISAEGYRLMHEYAKEADKRKLPQLAWLQSWIAHEKRYGVFMDYYLSKMWQQSDTI